MRSAKQRVFDITINGLKTWREPAFERGAIEVQHDIAIETKGFVHVREKYVGGARGPRLTAEDSPDYV